MHHSNSKSSFTLAEILVTIAILAVISTAVVIVINPVEYLKRARDSQRLSDLTNLSKTLSWFEADTGGREFMGTSSVVYVSIPDSTSTCANLGLPPLPSGWSYRCVSSSTLQNTDGTGWIPVNFSKLSFGKTLPKLPIDPINTTSSGQYYTYVRGGNNFELITLFESIKYKNLLENNEINGFYSLRNSANILTPWFRDKDLIAYWNLDEGNGNIVYDSSINNNYGTLFNDVIWRFGTNCKFGSCLEFDGVDDYVLGSMNNFDIQPNKTFTLWVYPIGANGCTISFKEPIGNNDAYFNLYPQPDSPIYLSVGWKNWVFDNTGYVIPANQWSFIVLTVSNELIKLYFNTNLIWSASRTNLPPGSPTHFKLGNRFYSNRPYNGRLDEVRIYNRALSENEINLLYNLNL